MEAREIQRGSARTAELVTTLQQLATLVGAEGQPPLTLRRQVITPGLGLEAAAATLRRQAEQIDRQLFTLLVMGEFKSGKSTLLNAILGQSLMPTRAVPTTGIITVLVYGHDDAVEVHYSNARQPRRVSWEAFRAEYTLTPHDAALVERGGVVNRFADVEYAQIASEHPICALRVRLVDSPGLGEHIHRERATLNFLHESQAVIFVLNALRPFSLNEREYITRELASHDLASIFFVVNRLNQVAAEDVETTREFMRGVLLDLMRERGLTFNEQLLQERLFFINAQAALGARQTTPVAEVPLKASGLPALEHALDRFLSGSAKTQATLTATRNLCARVVSQALERARMRVATLDLPLEQLRAQQRTAEAELARLSREQEQIERLILYDGQSLFTELRSSLFQFLTTLRLRWEYEPATVLDLRRITPQLLFDAAGGQQAAASRLQQYVSEAVEGYLRAKLAQWVADCDARVAERSTELQAELRKRVRLWSGQLDDVMQNVAGAPASGTSARQPLDQIVELPGGLLDTYDWSAALRASFRQSAGVMASFGAIGLQLYDWFSRLLRTLVEIFGQGAPVAGDVHVSTFRRLLGERVTGMLANDLWHDQLFPTTISDPAALARRLAAAQEPPAAFIWSLLTPAQQANLRQPSDDQEVRETLAEALNLAIAQGPGLYRAERFAEVRLRDETRLQAQHGPRPGWRVGDVNRWLIAETFRSGVTEKLPDTLYHHIIFEYTSLAERVTEPLQAAITEAHREVQRIVDTLAREQTYREGERRRLEQLSALMREQLALARQLTSPEE